MSDDRPRTLRRRVQPVNGPKCDVRTSFDYEANEWVVTIRAGDHATEVRGSTLSEASESAAEVLERHDWA